jgi:phosphoglycerate dehydrogenase-like enzyme
MTKKIECVPMGSINVLITLPLGEEARCRIAAISPKVKLIDVTELALTDLAKGDPAIQKKWSMLFKEIGGVNEPPQNVAANALKGLDDLLAKADVIFGVIPIKNLIARAPRLRWIQVAMAGVDYYLSKEIVESPVLLTNTHIHAIPIGEFVLGLMLMFAKKGPLCFQLKQDKLWKRFTPALLRSKTVGIIGLGSIGNEVARLAKAFGMRVIAIRRSAKRGTPARHVDKLLPRKQLRELLMESDFVVLTLPYTPETDRMIGEDEFRTMKSTAYLINVSRGRIVDEEALFRALEEHWIAGASLDAFVTEPLPENNRLWELPNVIITPHIAGNMEDYQSLAVEQFCENLKRYFSNRNLLNLVDKKRGY